MEPKIKILQVGKYFPPDWGGIETVCYELAEGLDNNKYVADILCLSKKEIKKELETNYKIYRIKQKLQLFSQPLSFSYLIKYKEIRNSYDVIHVHLPNLLAIIAVLMSPAKGKILLHWHSDVVKQKLFLWVYDFFVKKLIKKSDVILAPTKNHFKYSRYCKLFDGKSEVIPYCMSSDKLEITSDVYKLSTDIKEKYSGKKIVFSIGRLVSYKGFSNLIKSAQLLSNDCIVLIGGKGPLADELNSLIKTYKVENKVKLLGELTFDEMKAHYAACDLYCFPSINKSEMFGMVQLEAMFYGKPIVSTYIKGSGVQLVNKHAETGLIGGINDIEFLVESIMKILNDNELYIEYSKNSKNRFNSKFNVNVVMYEYNKLYKKLVIS